MTDDSHVPEDRRKPTGYVWSVRMKMDGPLGESFHGSYQTRHEAIAMATKKANLLDADGWEVRWRESMWRVREEPLECDRCDNVQYYDPLVRWTFADLGVFCSTNCFIRALHANGDDDRLRTLDATPHPEVR